MDNATENSAAEDTERRREAFAQAQKSGTNVYWFRRLKWAAPPVLRVTGAKPSFGAIEIMLFIVILASLAYVTITLSQR